VNGGLYVIIEIDGNVAISICGLIEGGGDLIE